MPIIPWTSFVQAVAGGLSPPGKRPVFTISSESCERSARCPEFSISNLACPTARKAELTVSGKIFHDGEWQEFEGIGFICLKKKDVRSCDAD